jgi:hypothetical protein
MPDISPPQEYTTVGHYNTSNYTTTTTTMSMLQDIPWKCFLLILFFPLFFFLSYRTFLDVDKYEKI